MKSNFASKLVKKKTRAGSVSQVESCLHSCGVASKVGRVSKRLTHSAEA